MKFSMYVCLAEPIKTRKEERSPKGIIKSIASQIIALTLTFEGGLLHLFACDRFVYVPRLSVCS